MKITAGRQKIEAGGRKIEDRDWKLETGNWKTAIPIFQLLSSSLHLLIPVSFIFFITLPASAELKKTGVENTHTLRINVRSDDDDRDFYLTRVQGYAEWGFAGIEEPLVVAPFWEYQSDLTANTWWKKAAGIEIGREFFDGWFYTGASFQHVWQKEENYPIELLDETTEWESRLVITPPLNWGLFKDKLKLRFFDEYTFDFSRGQCTFNEVGITLEWTAGEHLRIPAGWRHIDRIHDYDCDELEVSVVFCL